MTELADRSEPARQVLAGCFAEWEGHLSEGFASMREDGELSASADPGALATAVMAAVQGGLLLSQTVRGARLFELAMAMAVDHVGQHRTKPRADERTETAETAETAAAEQRTENKMGR